jgi:glycosyltransferase involved in cell wall biosynthesis
MTEPVKMLAIMNSRIKKLGSFEDYIVSFARKAREQGWTLGFIFPGMGAPDVIQRIESEQARILETTAPWASKQGVFQLIQRIREFKPTIVNFHFCDTISYLPVFLYCRLAGISVIYHYHGEIRPLSTLTWRNAHLSALRLLSWFWTGVITVSEANKRFLRALHIATPIEVVYNGIDVIAFREQFAALDKLPSESAGDEFVQCLYIGSIIDRKRVDILLRAFAIVKSEFPLARLTVVGGGALESSSKKLASDLQLDDVVHFTGLMIQYPFELLKHADILVSASESESFGLVFAEAMSFELPVVACTVGGVPEVVANGETGLLVEANNPEAFAAALLVLLKDRTLRTQMGQAGFERVQRAFQLPGTIDATFQAFARLS